MATAEPQQVARGQELQGPEGQHPAGRRDQAEAEHQGQQQAEVEGLALTGRILQATGDRRQGNGVVRGEHRLQPHQQRQEQQHLAPLVGGLQQRREGLDRFGFHTQRRAATAPGGCSRRSNQQAL